MFDDPELAALRDETAAGTEIVRELLAPHPPFHEGTVETAREGIPGVPQAPVLDHGITRTIDGPGGGIPLRIFVPEHPYPAGPDDCLAAAEWVIANAEAEWGVRDPDVSPLWADLSGLPPSLLSVGTRVPLLDDSLFMAARLRAAGNEATLDVYPEAIHGFTVLPGAAGEVANRRANEFIASCWS